MTSPCLQTPLPSPMQLWLDEMADANILLAGMLAVMHPTLAEAANTLMDKLDAEEVGESIRAWGSPFGALSVISNRESLPHRDTKSMITMYDLLLSCGPYMHAFLNFPDLKIVASYNPGTVVALNGRLVRHAVPSIPRPRLCYAYYFREAVFYRNHVMDPGFMSQTFYISDMRFVEEYLLSKPVQYTGRC